MEDLESVADARARYFAANGFSEASYSDAWVKLKLGPIPLWFPNSASRKRAIPLHDLHHVATGYATTWIGEAEIAAWEIGGSCRDHWAAWVLNLGALAYGAALAPRRVLRAFTHGRHARNLYGSEFEPALLSLTVGQLRERLALGSAPDPTPRDALACAGWVIVAWLPALAAAAAAVAYVVR